MMINAYFIGQYATLHKHVYLFKYNLINLCRKMLILLYFYLIIKDPLIFLAKSILIQMVEKFSMMYPLTRKTKTLWQLFSTEPPL